MKIAIIGAGGQARIVYEILTYDHNMEVVAFVDNIVRGSDERIMGIPVMGDHSVLPRLLENGLRGAIIGVGDNKIREQRFDELIGTGLELVNAVHPTSYIAPSARLGRGVTVAIGAIIGTGTRIGDNVIINNGAIIDHENEIGNHVHVAPGCSLAGRVTVKKGTFIGIGTVVKEYLTIGENVTIGAGSVVLEDLPDNVVAVGAPARIVKNKTEGGRQ
jgi:sugar O-acyltransferase (sialic acid O-acetyltransferase NeuD family)